MEKYNKEHNVRHKMAQFASFLTYHGTGDVEYLIGYFVETIYRFEHGFLNHMI